MRAESRVTGAGAVAAREEHAVERVGLDIRQCCGMAHGTHGLSVVHEFLGCVREEVGTHASTVDGDRATADRSKRNLVTRFFEDLFSSMYI